MDYKLLAIGLCEQVSRHALDNSTKRPALLSEEQEHHEGGYLPHCGILHQCKRKGFLCTCISITRMIGCAPDFRGLGSVGHLLQR
jgi:hypothetical protein